MNLKLIKLKIFIIIVNFNISFLFYSYQLIGFGIGLLEGVDPNPDNFVCAGIVHSKNAQIGVLLRLEPNKAALVSSKICYIDLFWRVRSEI